MKSKEKIEVRGFLFYNELEKRNLAYLKSEFFLIRNWQMRGMKNIKPFRNCQKGNDEKIMLCTARYGCES